MPYLKGQCHEIFECLFFHQKAPPGPHRDTLGWFHFLPKIHRDIEQKVGSAVYDTPQNGDSAVYLTPCNGDWAVYLTPRNYYHKVVFLYFVLFEPFYKWFEIRRKEFQNGDSALYLTLRKWYPIQISPWIFGKNPNHPRVPLRGPGGPIWCKKPTLKNLVTLSL